MKVVIAGNAERAHVTAARAVAEAFGMTMELGDEPQPGAFNIGPPEFAAKAEIVQDLLDTTPADKRWDLMFEGEDGSWVEASASTLIPTTSWEETTYMHRSPLSHLLKLKLDRMRRHIDDAPGPWFGELDMPGGWTSDLRDQMPQA